MVFWQWCHATGGRVLKFCCTVVGWHTYNNINNHNNNNNNNNVYLIKRPFSQAPLKCSVKIIYNIIIPNIICL